ncbi:MAG TPA: cache domain-containing protein, partial [Lachnospiraceae bacterium]|nr:cache domain-containing protein [Lachnospiraceae bacterium]
MKKRINKNSISIRSIIIIVFVLFLMVTVICTGSIVFANWKSSSKETIEKVSEDMNREITDEISYLLDVPESIIKVNRTLIQNGLIDLKDAEEREKFFVGVLKTNENEVYSFSYGMETGEYYGARREENGNIVVMRNNEETKGRTRYYSVKSDLTAGDLVMETDKYDPQERAWYRTAKEAGAPIFSPIFKHFVLNETCVSATWPIYSEDSTLIGVLGAHMLLSNIDDYLSEHVESMNGYALIIEKDTGELRTKCLNIGENIGAPASFAVLYHALSRGSYLSVSITRSPAV